MPKNEKKKTGNDGYQPLQKGYQPSQSTDKIKPPKGGTGETQTSQGNSYSGQSQNSD